MSLENRLRVLALAALIALFWAFPTSRLRRGLVPPPPSYPAAPTAAPPRPAAPIRVKRRIRKKRAAPEPAKKPNPEIERKRLRGARLRERGESLGGGAPEKP